MKNKEKFPQNLPSHTPKPKKEEAEFGPGKKDIIICPECGCVYYFKSWHHRLEDYPHLKEDKNVNFSLCPACQMIKEGKFEGEILIENCPKEIEKELIALVKNMGEKAFEKDPQDRVISIKKLKKGKIQVLTTENVLAIKIAKKIKETFKGKLKIVFSKEESTARAKISF